MSEISHHKDTISSEDQYKNVLGALTHRSRPPALLRLMMRGVEAYRQSRRIGWSRRQNKEGVKTFASFKLTGGDRSFARSAASIALNTFLEIDSARSEFLTELVADDSLMMFLFFQESRLPSPDGKIHLYESVTLSLGRAVKGAPRYRDRFDLILDCPVVDANATKLSTIRAYIEPYETPEALALSSTEGSLFASTLLDELVRFYKVSRHDDALRWHHWTNDYIDYFGPRTLPVVGAIFPTELDESYQMLLDDPAGTIVTNVA